ncbi:hypothetical membrane protein [Rhodococcus gordoniae]|uniref:Hypothetical membrane protein n=1 Tax=Rhodococcus gordoniae TaxID=223392 RepID=A0A379M120_9NOCA|nr:hypothetical protein [Rhodococcus gordoniae]SUE15105.1 hypothetical membrane protein [Rhodococcus gordoniae]
MSENRSNDTGQISVAELLARNGQKVGTRAGGRRRRGASGGISVAELTGEIPITRAADDKTAEQTDPVAPAETETREPATPVDRTAETPKTATFALSDVEKTTVTPRVAAESKTAPAKTPPVKAPAKMPPVKAPAKTPPVKAAAKTPPVKAPAKTPSVKTGSTTPPAETPPSPEANATVSKASVSAPPKVESPTEIIRPEALPRRARAHLGAVAATGAQPGEAVPDKKSEKASAPAVSARKADVAEPRLLSGPASDLQGTGSDLDDSTDTIGAAAGTSDAPAEKTSPATRSRKSRGTGSSAAAADDSARKSSGDADQGSSLKQWALLIVESVAAIVAGGLLFKGFERLWDLMPWVAFALALLVIVGLVALVRVLRRTDDITSQLIALAVGAFVSFGPLLFLLPGG